MARSNSCLCFCGSGIWTGREFPISKLSVSSPVLGTFQKVGKLRMETVSGLRTTQTLSGVLESNLDKLNYLLKNNTNNFHIDYGPSALSNHLSHALIAIWGLGGSANLLDK